MKPRRQLSQLTVNLSILTENINLLKASYPDKNILFMVKADAYGHGLIPIVEHSYNHCEIKSFGVASLSEALEIREKIPEAECDIYVFSELALELAENSDVYTNFRIFPVISCERDLDFFLEDSRFREFPLCLKFNTGMNRLGFSHEDGARIVKKLQGSGRSEVFHLMSHFANSSMPIEKNKRNILQTQRFEELKSIFRSEGIGIQSTSLANSAALEQGFCGENEFIRPGLMLYGASSLAPKYRDLSHWQGKGISKLESTVLKVFRVKKGDPVSYGSTPCPENGLIAIVAAGYGDGVSTRYQGARINFGNYTGMVCGRVCMDVTTVLFPLEAKILEGDKVTFWNYERGRLNHVSEQTKTIPYELVTQLTARIPRYYTTEKIRP